MKNKPNKIYLQIDSSEDECNDFDELFSEAITWCGEKIYETDIEYFSKEILFKAYKQGIEDSRYFVDNSKFIEDEFNDWFNKIKQ